MQNISATRLTVFVFFCFSFLGAKGQSIENQLPVIDFAKVQLAQNITANCLYFADTLNQFSDENLANIPFNQKIPTGIARTVKPKLVSKNIYLKFSIYNSSDSIMNCFFLPGFYFTSIKLYGIDSVTKKAILIEPDKIAASMHSMFSKISISPHDTMTVIAQLHFIKSTVNKLTPQLSKGYYLPSLVNRLQNPNRLNNIIAYMVCGILLMMILYSIAVFWMNGNIEFIYYAGYATGMCLLFYLKALLYNNPIQFNYFFESYLDFIIQSVGIIFYIIFLKQFTESKIRFPVLNKVFIIELFATVIGIMGFSYYYFFSDNFVVQDRIENMTKYFWSLSTIFFIAYTLVTKSKYLTYLAIGHIFLFFFGILSLYLIGSSSRFGDSIPILLNDSLFYYQMGVTFELIFFLAALAFKNRKDIIERTEERERLKLENERKEFEKQMAVLAAQQEERNRISADMHDELGSGVTAIRLMSELVKAKMKNNTLPEIEKISNSANDLIGKMNTIIWTMKSSNDSIDNLVAYTRAYALEYFENTGINCHFHYPESIPVLEMNGEKRRNIFLCVKEALNNIVKHAKATEVWINFDIGQQLAITIKDNGVGINLDKLREFGNGLHNMKKRMEDIEGSFEMLNKQGTTTILTVSV